MTGPSALSLVDGPLPVVLLALGALGLTGVLAARRFDAGWWRWIGAALLVGAVVALTVNPLLVDLLALFPEPIPGPVVNWLAAGAAVVVLVIGALRHTTVARKLLALGSGALVLLTVGSQVNVAFAEYPTLGDLLYGGVDVSAFAPGASGGSGPETVPVAERWPGGATTAHGAVEAAQIPGTASGLVAREAYVYLPPAYQVPDPPRLPVMVVVAGQPGGPQDWISSGELPQILDRFAAAHNGLAPVTVVVDPNGSEFGNTMCMDSSIAKADTYLSVDVRDWITTQLRVDTNPAHWTFAGWSFGGTCALQMGTRHPDIWRNVIAIQAEREPALGPDRQQTVETAFGGSPDAAAEFDALTPLTLMQTRTYPDTWAYFASGGADQTFTGYMQELVRAAEAARMHVRSGLVPGQGHSWAVPVNQLPVALGWLAPTLGFTTP